MDNTTLAIISSILFVSFHLLIKSYIKKSYKLPPGPKSIPIFGCIFSLGDKPHRTFFELSKIYGPLIRVKLGSVTTIVISSASVAKEMFFNDQALSSRTIPDSVRACDHSKFSYAWIPISPKWRNLKKISVIQLLSNKRLDASQDLRLAMVKQLLAHVQDCSIKKLPIDIGKVSFTTTLNLLSNTIFSMELASYESSTSQELKNLVWNIMKEMGRPNYCDFFPILGYIDPFGVRRRMASHYSKLLNLFKEIIHKRIKIRSTNPLQAKPTNDILDILLNLHEENELSMDDLLHLLVDMFDAGTDTTANTLEWAMTELLKSPKIMIEVQNEIDNALGSDYSIVQESDISKLPYFQAVIKETFRLHPPTAYLLPRKADADVKLCGYIVPKNSQVLVSLWAIGRDPKIWKNPEVFSPEKFLECDIDFKGQNFELLPFGAGRRICPGIALSCRMLTLMMSNLLYKYNWELEHGMHLNDLDLEEKVGMTLQKVKPLQIIPIPRNN
ncbi:cytochrome P450 76AD1-like [Amaranthus tricolor]|uniref:cytochrome P450 76AD1-like n=1 Tax=Amaranthus tricolor TaxID=29722 RepID=UPI00258F3F79|nr:cytochrome P450 76AD1-like [Amaranthus tricolor]